MKFQFIFCFATIFLTACTTTQQNKITNSKNITRTTSSKDFKCPEVIYKKLLCTRVLGDEEKFKNSYILDSVKFYTNSSNGSCMVKYELQNFGTGFDKERKAESIKKIIPLLATNKHEELETNLRIQKNYHKTRFTFERPIKSEVTHQINGDTIQTKEILENLVANTTMTFAPDGFTRNKEDIEYNPACDAFTGKCKLENLKIKKMKLTCKTMSR